MTTQNGDREPIGAPARPTRMRRLATTTALAAVLLLGGCGSDDGGDDVATDPAPTPTTATPTPTAAPTVGTYPEFGPTDYTYTLTVTCFCPGAGIPIKITVADDEVVDAVYGAGEGKGGDLEGQQADEPFRLSIDDVIERANDTEAYKVEVDWPAGQDWPTRVYVDNDDRTADDETGFDLADVVTT